MTHNHSWLITANTVDGIFTVLIHICLCLTIFGHFSRWLLYMRGTKVTSKPFFYLPLTHVPWRCGTQLLKVLYIHLVPWMNGIYIPTSCIFDKHISSFNDRIAHICLKAKCYVLNAMYAFLINPSHNLLPLKSGKPICRVNYIKLPIMMTS